MKVPEVRGREGVKFCSYRTEEDGGRRGESRCAPRRLCPSKAPSKRPKVPSRCDRRLTKFGKFLYLGIRSREKVWSVGSSKCKWPRVQTLSRNFQQPACALLDS